MKLINLKIKGFKNLTGPDGWFVIDFTNKNGITVLVGNNGSGKSNVLEAISAIFTGLYKDKKKFDFEFELELSAKQSSGGIGTAAIGTVAIGSGGQFDKKIVISYILGIFSSNHDVGFLKLIANYSGDEDRLFKEYYKPFEEEYKKQIKKTTKSGFKNNLIYVDKRDWQKVILTLAVYDFDFLKNKTGIEKIENIEIDFDIKEIEKYDKNPNPTTAFIEKINAEKIKSKEYNLDFFINKFTDKNVAVYGESKWGDGSVYGGGEIDKKEFYDNLFLAEQFGFIKNIEINFSEEENTYSLSEGEKKQILMYFIFEFLADKDSIILLDEPDSYIHVGNKYRLKDIFEKFRDDFGEGEIILTTHSPTLMYSFEKKHLEFLDSGEIKTKEKQEILSSITDDSMSFSDKLEILTTTKDILLVEGKTDEKYMTIALEKLKIENEEYKDLDFEFLIIGGTDGECWKNILDKIKPKNNQKIIALLDRDKAGKECANKILDKEIDLNSFDGEMYDNKFIYLIPKKEGFTKTHFEVEDYFSIDILRDFTFENMETFENLKKGFNKNNFAEKCKEFDMADFEEFKALFDKILEIKVIGSR